MNEELYNTQVELEVDMRNLSIAKFLKGHTQGELSDTLTGSYLLSGYLRPMSEAISQFLKEAGSGKVGRRHIAYSGLCQLEPEVTSYLWIKALLSRMPLYARAGTHISTVSLAIYAAGLLQDELRIRRFEENHKALLSKVLTDFDRRELPRYKRKEYLQAVISEAGEDWSIWSKTEMVHIGVKLLDLFIQTTGDVQVRSVKHGKNRLDIVVPSDGLLAACERIREDNEGNTTIWLPMVHPPVPWSTETLDRGGYLTHHVSSYPLVKGSRRAYRRSLARLVSEGKLEVTLTALNATQETAWQVNAPVLDALQYVYRRNIDCGALPKADAIVPDPPPVGLEFLPSDDLRVIEYRRYRAVIHEHNRRVVGKRVQAISALHIASRFSKYERLYFPHDLDSRGRAYPKPNHLNPQGPDYVKGLLKFAEGKPLGDDGFFWLGVHGANCFGKDKLPITERAEWAEGNIENIKAVARSPKDYLWWTQADNPVQFLAFCLEYADAFDRPKEYVSHLHVDLDATCSGLQHFSAMLRDEVGGFHVNMVPNPVRQDVYGAVATEAVSLFTRDMMAGGDRSAMARAWLDSGLMDRSTTKRPVMVKPYAGTQQSCLGYVREAVEDKFKAGHPLPWAKDDLFNFKLYGGLIVWEAIPSVVVAADGAMRWLSSVSRLVGKSQPEVKRVEWTTPVGFPVWLSKFNVRSRCIETFLDGSRYQPRVVEETDQLDPRQMASSVPPSFVHSLDGAHLQLTVSKAVAEGIGSFALVHDSFGTHASDISRFAKIIREAFVELYQTDVLAEFLESAKQIIAPEYFEEIPPIPDRGNLDLKGVLENEYFFS